MFDTNPLYPVCFENIFFQFIACPFILLKVSFEKQMLLILMKSSFSFSFAICVFLCSIQKILCLWFSHKNPPQENKGKEESEVRISFLLAPSLQDQEKLVESLKEKSQFLSVSLLPMALFPGSYPFTALLLLVLVYSMIFYNFPISHQHQCK